MAVLMDTPLHFDLPFRFAGTVPTTATVTQDSLDDISNCVEAILRTVKGQRLEITDFGVEDLTFKQAPINEAELIQTVLSYEPRASIMLEQLLDLYDATHTTVDVNISKSGGTST